MKLEELKEKYPCDVPVQIAADCLGKTAMYVRIGLRNNRLPFGTAVQGEGGRWSYSIPTELFITYMSGGWLHNLYA